MEFKLIKRSSLLAKLNRYWGVASTTWLMLIKLKGLTLYSETLELSWNIEPNRIFSLFWGIFEFEPNYILLHLNEFTWCIWCIWMILMSSVRSNWTRKNLEIMKKFDLVRYSKKVLEFHCTLFFYSFTSLAIQICKKWTFMNVHSSFSFNFLVNNVFFLHVNGKNSKYGHLKDVKRILFWVIILKYTKKIIIKVIVYIKTSNFDPGV